MKKIISSLLILLLFFNCSQDEEMEQFELTTEISPSEGGTISPSKAKFDSGEEVDLTATPAEGYFFKNWSGAVSSKEIPLTITIDADKKIKATFEKLDGDGDGVADDVDQCPITTEGQTVDARGCSDTQNDTDDDGVTDNSDECPDTPKDETVDDNGCSESQKDTDKDGISDNLGQCTETPEGETVNEEGCSESQKDSDGDGISDHIDECPDTPDRDRVDDKGCSDCQKDSDGDGVPDDIDQCPETQEGENVDGNGCAETINTYIPDDIFEQQLIDLGYDDKLDDHVLTSNIVNVEGLVLYGDEDDSNAFVDLTGLEEFFSLKNLTLVVMDIGNYFNPGDYQNLTTLNLHYIGLSTLVIDETSNLEKLEFSNSSGILSITNNSSLTSVFLEDAQNKSVMISGNSKLTSFYTFDGHLGDVSITNNPGLKSIGFEAIIIDDLDFSNNPELETFRMSVRNDINYPIDFSTYPNLKSITIGYEGRFNNIDISNNPLLEYMDANSSGITSLDVSNNNLLETLYVSDTEITVLDLSNNNSIVFLEAGNTNLTCIQVNQEQLDNIPSGWSKDPKTSYSLDCFN